MKKLFCDLCKKQIKEFSEKHPSYRSLNEFFEMAKVKEVCDPCFIKIDKAIIKATSESDVFFKKRLKELLKLSDKELEHEINA